MFVLCSRWTELYFEGTPILTSEGTTHRLSTSNKRLSPTSKSSKDFIKESKRNLPLSPYSWTNINDDQKPLKSTQVDEICGTGTESPQFLSYHKILISHLLINTTNFLIPSSQVSILAFIFLFFCLPNYSYWWKCSMLLWTRDNFCVPHSPWSGTHKNAWCTLFADVFSVLVLHQWQI